MDVGRSFFNRDTRDILITFAVAPETDWISIESIKFVGGTGIVYRVNLTKYLQNTSTNRVYSLFIRFIT